MKIVKPGIKEAKGMLYFECNECGCGFVMHRSEFDAEHIKIETGCCIPCPYYIIECPCCNQLIRIPSTAMDKIYHVKYLDMMSKMNKEETYESTQKEDI